MPRARCQICGEYIGWDAGCPIHGFVHCFDCCPTDDFDDFDADELGLDPEEDFDA